MKKFTPEMKLLILCLLQDLDDDKETEISKLLVSPLNWNLFIQLAEHHRVYPVVYKNLGKIANAEVDNNAINQLKDLYYDNVLNSLKLTGELLKITELIKNEGISVISIKGPILGLAIYGDITFRPSKDLDVLIDPHDLDRAENLLLEIGYLKIEEPTMTKNQREFTINREKHSSYMKGNVCIELHWRLDPDFLDVPLSDLWQRSEQLTVQGKKVNVLSKEDELLYLAFHGSKHGWKRLRWLCDIAEKVRGNSINWEVVLLSAEKFQITPMLFLSLILIKEIFNIPFPAACADIAKTSCVGKQLALMALPMIADIDVKPGLPSYSQYFHFIKYRFLLSCGIRGKARYVKTLFEPSHFDFKAVKISDKGFFLYYLVWPLMKIKRMINALKN